MHFSFEIFNTELLHKFAMLTKSHDKTDALNHQLTCIDFSPERLHDCRVEKK